MAPSQNDGQDHLVAQTTLTFPSKPPATKASQGRVSFAGLGSDVSEPSPEPLVAEPPPAAPAMSSSLYSVRTPLTDADRSAEFFSLQLPTGFIFYPFKSLSAKLIRGRHQSKFSMAAKSESLRYCVEAVTATLGDGINAADLTLKDFYYVMYWLRIASYTKTDFTHVSVCHDPEHHMKVGTGELPKETLKTVHILNSTTIEEKHLDLENLKAMEFPLCRKANLALHPACMGDAITMSEEFDSQSEDFEETSYLADLGSFLNPAHGTLQERMAIVEALDPDTIEEIKQFRRVVNACGVTETINVRCKECGAVSRTEMSISAHAFF